MQVAIMAAGLGSRLKDLTTQTPKALIEVAGRPLVDYALAFARALGADHRVVVTGFCHADVAARVGDAATVVENTEFRKGNLLSMRAALRGLGRDGFLLMNTDHIYRPSIAELVAGACGRATEVTAFCDFDRTLGKDDMKVALDAQRCVREMAKTLATFDAGYVGMTYVPAARRAVYEAAAARVLAEQGDAIHVEAVLVALVRGGIPVAIADISGHGWLEIDEPHEREHADAVLARERWWD